VIISPTTLIHTCLTRGNRETFAVGFIAVDSSATTNGEINVWAIKDFGVEVVFDVGNAVVALMSPKQRKRKKEEYNVEQQN